MKQFQLLKLMFYSALPQGNTPFCWLQLLTKINFSFEKLIFYGGGSSITVSFIELNLGPEGQVADSRTGMQRDPRRETFLLRRVYNAWAKHDRRC